MTRVNMNRGPEPKKLKIKGDWARAVRKVLRKPKTNKG